MKNVSVTGQGLVEQVTERCLIHDTAEWCQVQGFHGNITAATGQPRIVGGLVFLSPHHDFSCIPGGWRANARRRRVALELMCDHTNANIPFVDLAFEIGQRGLMRFGSITPPLTWFIREIFLTNFHHQMSVASLSGNAVSFQASPDLLVRRSSFVFFNRGRKIRVADADVGVYEHRLKGVLRNS